MSKRIGLISGILGVVGGILIIAAAISKDSFPKPLYFIIVICCAANLTAIILNYRYFKNAKEKNISKNEHKTRRSR